MVVRLQQYYGKINKIEQSITLTFSKSFQNTNDSSATVFTEKDSKGKASASAYKKILNTYFKIRTLFSMIKESNN